MTLEAYDPTYFNRTRSFTGNGASIQAIGDILSYSSVNNFTGSEPIPNTTSGVHLGIGTATNFAPNRSGHTLCAI